MAGIWVDWEQLERRTVIPGFVGRFCHSESMTFALWEIAEGAVLPEHGHVHEQVAYVLDGVFELTLPGEVRRLTAGMISSIPSNVRHSGRALANCRILDVFQPVREDYRDGLKATLITSG
ncbi:MAG: cupin domain-containing protein [Rhizobiaceae bacterium]|nr:cupin domain-containing protein [Rhizobiaceae bacterium]